MKEQLSPSGPTLPPLWESSECSALLMNIKKKNNAVTRIGHYLLFVLARCANCQKRDTSVSTGSWKKIWGFQFEHKAESNFFLTAYVNSDITFTGNSAGAQRDT